MMIKDDADNRKYVTLLSLMADNSGKFDICALIYDLCTGNKCTYYDEKQEIEVYEPIYDRMLDVKNISKNSYKDLKKVTRYIKNKFVHKVKNETDDNNMVVVPEGETVATYVSTRFDDVFIKSIIEDYYHGELLDFEYILSKGE